MGHAGRDRAPGAHEHRQDLPRGRTAARAPDGDDRLPPPPARARELRPARAAPGRGRRRPHHGRGADRSPRAAVLRVHGGGDAARPPRRVPGRGRDPARRRPRARPRLHRPPPARAGLRGDDVPGRGDHQAPAAPARAGGGLHRARAALHPHLRRPQEAGPAAAAKRDRRLLPGRPLRGGGARAARDGGSGRRVRRPVSTDAQRAGRALPGGRGGLPGGHRRHRHGPQPRHRPRGLHRARQVRRPRPASLAPGRGRPDRRPCRAPHAGRDVRPDPRPRAVRRCLGGGDRGAPLRAPRSPLLAQRGPRLLFARGAPVQSRAPSACSGTWPRSRTSAT